MAEVRRNRDGGRKHNTMKDRRSLIQTNATHVTVQPDYMTQSHYCSLFISTDTHVHTNSIVSTIPLSWFDQTNHSGLVG